jgi:hypothetical protein
LISGCLFLIPIGCLAPDNAALPGFLDGHLKIVSPNEVELAESTPSKQTTENYAEYPLIIRSGAGEKQTARITTDADGNYRIEERGFVPLGLRLLLSSSSPPVGWMI